MKKLLTRILLCVLSITLICTFLSCAESKKECTTGKLDEVSNSTINSILSKPDENYKVDEAYLEIAQGMTKIPTVEELNLPEDLTSDDNPEAFGLMIYDGTKYVHADKTEGIFDVNKKTFIFAHGMGYNAEWHNTKGFYDAGYNVLALHWGAFASEKNQDMASVGDKIWMYDGSLRYRAGKDISWQNGDKINYSVVEMYASYYCDFFNRYPNYDSREITIGGHSYGGMITTGLLSYLTTAFRSGILEARFLPDKVILCDPYLMKCSTLRHIRWLSDAQVPEFGGIAYFAGQAVIMAQKLGISVSLLRSSSFIGTPFMIAFGFDQKVCEEQQNKFKSSLLHIDGNANTMLNLSEAHNYGHHWPSLMTREFYDSENTDEYAFSIFNPYHANFARVGENYILDYNLTPDTLEDDTIVLENPGKTKLYGFVFCDENNNGKMDERITKHILGATVTVKNSKGDVAYEGTTSLNGYFEFRADPDTYTISVALPEGYSLTKEETVVKVAKGDYFVDALISAKKA